MKKRKLTVRENFETGVNGGSGSSDMRENRGLEERESLHFLNGGGWQREKVEELTLLVC